MDGVTTNNNFLGEIPTNPLDQFDNVTYNIIYDYTISVHARSRVRAFRFIDFHYFSRSPPLSIVEGNN